MRSALIVSGLWTILALPAAGQNTPPLRPGFPVVLAGAGPVRSSHPAVGDLDNDGVKEIVIGTANRRVYVLRANGAVMSGWPITMPGEIGASPALGDLNGDGFLDVVVACGSTFDPTGSGEVRAYNRNGGLMWSLVPGDENGDFRPDGVFSTPAIGDVDGDGANEVVFGSWDFRLYAVRGATGALLPGFPPNPSGLGHGLRDTIWSSPVLADLDGDGKLEIIIGVDTHAEGPPVNTPNGGAIHVFRSNGTFFPGFPQFIDQTLMSSPAVGDIDGDRIPDIVAGGGTFYSGAVGRKVYAWKRDGTFVSGWPVTTVGQVFSSPALADLTGDGVADVIVGDEPNSGADPYLYAFSGNGALLWQVRPRSYFATTPNIGSPVVADVTGDGQVDILVAVNTEITVISRTGAQLTDPGPAPSVDPRPTYYTNTSIISGAAVTDLEGDGTLDVVAASGDPFPSPTSATVYVWNPTAVGPAPWPGFRRDSRRRGYGPATLGPPANNLRFFTLTPCRLADTRLNSIALTAGNVVSFGLAARCGIPASARAVAVNVTATQPTHAGHFRLFPAATAAPLTSTINFSAGQTRANNGILALSSWGDLSILPILPAGGSTHLILDTVGYFE